MTDNTPPVALEPVRKSRVCPFCGATPHHGLGKVQHCQLHGEPFQHFSIWCPRGCAKITRANADIARRDWEGIDTRTPSHSDLVEALRDARKIIADIDDYMKRPGRGDWGEECACCMGELLDDDRQAIAKIDAILTKAEAPHG